MLSVELINDDRVSQFECQHGELSMQMHHGSDVNCTSTPNDDVEFSRSAVQ